MLTLASCRLVGFDSLVMISGVALTRRRFRIACRACGRSLDDARGMGVKGD